MDYRTYVYGDPTGGGDDATLSLPIWATPPEEIVTHNVTDDGAYTETFELEGEADE